MSDSPCNVFVLIYVACYILHQIERIVNIKINISVTLICRDADCLKVEEIREFRNFITCPIRYALAKFWGDCWFYGIFQVMAYLL